MNQGIVKFFKEDKGYGFIMDNETKKEYFVHVTNCSHKLQRDDQVTFDVEMGKKGEIAVNVTLIQ